MFTGDKPQYSIVYGHGKDAYIHACLPEKEQKKNDVGEFSELIGFHSSNYGSR